VIGVVTGLAPHVLHHVGLLAGAALIAGTGGTTVFAVVGLAAFTPLLLRLKRRFASWWAPVIGLAVFAVMFSVSAFLIGPAISGGGADPSGGRPPAPPVNHSGHHG
jgi:predicted PurR-regulated permease PerM